MVTSPDYPSLKRKLASTSLKRGKTHEGTFRNYFVMGCLDEASVAKAMLQDVDVRYGPQQWQRQSH